MSGKYNNRSLLFVFLVLAAIFIISRFTSLKKPEQTLNTRIVQIDTSQVSSILLYPEAEKGVLLELRKAGTAWTVTRNEITAAANAGEIKNTLAELTELKAEQLVALSSDRWGEYGVLDSLGTRVVVKEGNKVTLDLIVGRFQYQPPPQNSYSPYGQNQVSGKTYVRRSGEEKVYSVNGFLAMSLNQEFSRWRDRTLTSLKASGISRIIFDYPADSGFIAERNDAGWMVSGILADSAQMVNYLRENSNRTHFRFSEGFQPGSAPDYSVVFEGDNMKPQQLKAFVLKEDSILLNSSVNPDTWFLFSQEELNDLFPASVTLITGGSL